MTTKISVSTSDFKDYEIIKAMGYVGSKMLYDKNDLCLTSEAL